MSRYGGDGLGAPGGRRSPEILQGNESGKKGAIRWTRSGEQNFTWGFEHSTKTRAHAAQFNTVRCD